MSEDAAVAEAPAGKRSRAILIGLAVAVLMGGGGFYATYTGLVGPFQASPALTDHAADRQAAPQRQFAYIPLDPIIVNIGTREQARLLRFNASLEVLPAQASEVSRLKPRIIDVLNTYLRALEMHELEEPAALIRLRSQMLRRVQIVTGSGRVNDLLVTEFVFN